VRFSLKTDANIWDDGYPSGGNYWSDYNGTDLYTEQHQNVTGSDGLGDVPYIINEDNQDNYPLMKAWGSVSATIDIDPNTLNLKSRGRWITAHIELPEGYEEENINVATILLNNTISAIWVKALVVKFDRAEVIDYVYNSGRFSRKFMTITLTITGELSDGTRFEGSDTIWVMMPRGKGGPPHMRDFIK